MNSSAGSADRNSSRTTLFGAAERDEAASLVARAIEEDLPDGDVTSETLFGVTEPLARFACTAREPGILCGLPVVEILYGQIDDGVELRPSRRDGDPVGAGEVFLEILGRARSLLRGERIALNFLQRLSGVASRTALWRRALGSRPVTLLDTRKTTPGWRRLEKYAVRAGGGTNHRQSLSDGILLKDNHASLLRAVGRRDMRGWIGAFRERCPGVFLEVEVDSRDEFLEARAAGVDAILLDNFSTADLAWAVRQNRTLPAPRPLLEASGGLTLETAPEVAATGVDRISVGALTHSAPAMDISMDFSELVDFELTEKQGES